MSIGRNNKAVLTGQRTWIRHPGRADATAFVTLARRSRGFHRPWVKPPTTEEQFLEWLGNRRPPRQRPLLVCRRTDDAIVGNINISEIVLGAFRSAFLGYWIGEPFQKQGYATEGFRLVLRYSFGELHLHRLEANESRKNRSRG